MSCSSRLVTHMWRLGRRRLTSPTRNSRSSSRGDCDGMEDVIGFYFIFFFFESVYSRILVTVLRK